MSKFKTPMKPIAIIQKLELAKSKKSQEKVIRDAWESDSEDFFLGLELSVDPKIDFHIKSAPEIQDKDDGSEGTLTFNEFHLLAKKLQSKEISGEDARNAIVGAALKANITEWNLWYRRILLKTLKNHIPMNVVTSTLLTLTSH